MPIRKKLINIELNYNNAGLSRAHSRLLKADGRRWRMEICACLAAACTRIAQITLTTRWCTYTLAALAGMATTALKINPVSTAKECDIVEDTTYRQSTSTTVKRISLGIRACPRAECSSLRTYTLSILAYLRARTLFIRNI